MEELDPLYFAPAPILVLTPHFTIKLINRECEQQLSTTAAAAINRPCKDLLALESHSAFALALNDAAHSPLSSISRRLTFLDTEKPDVRFQMEVSISAWHPRDKAGKSSSNQSTSNTKFIHECFFTLILTPITQASEKKSSNSSNSHLLGFQDLTKNEILTHVLEYDSQTIMMALSRDGKTMHCNQACEELVFTGIPKEKVSEVDDVWLAKNLQVWDPKFTRKYTFEEWPLYKVSRLGKTVAPEVVGLLDNSGAKILLEITGRPIRNAALQHIGGSVTCQDVTVEELEKRKQVEAKSEEMFQRVCQTLPQLVWTAEANGSVTWFSESWFEYTGTTSDSSVGISWMDIVHPDDFNNFSQEWSQSLRTGELYSVDYRLRRWDGEWRWHVGRASPMLDEKGTIIKWVGSCTDVHAQALALTESRRTQAQLRDLLDLSKVTLWAVDTDTKVTIAQGQSRYSLEIGKSILELWPNQVVRDAIELALTGTSSMKEIQVESRWFRTQFSPLRATAAVQAPGTESAPREEGEIIGAAGTSIDITDRKQAELRLHESLEEKSKALLLANSANESSRAKSQFLANMSHEIRTPIAGIIGLADLLFDTELNSEQKEYAESISRGGQHLLSVINDILDFSKVEIGKLEIEEAPFSLPIVILDTRKMLSFASQKKGLTFIENSNLNYTGRLIGDGGRLRQILTNLLTNAIKFTSEGSVTLNCFESTEDAEQIKIRFEIIDTGCGIRESTLTKLFQPFTQADASTARRFGGTGLGLTICKNLINLMSGTIGLQSEEGKGSKAWFEIPFKKELVSSRPVHSPQEINSVVGSTFNDPFRRPKKDIWILVAEDNKINQVIALKTLQKLGFNAVAAENGKVALSLLNERPFDAILMDVQMPILSGYDATRCVRGLENPELRSIPIIALTASAIHGEREKAIDSGMDDYLSKPAKASELDRMLLKWLFDSEARQSLSRHLDTNAKLSSPSPTPVSPQHLSLI